MNTSNENFPPVDTRTPVLIFTMYHHIGVGIVRSLGRMGVTVHTVEADRMAPGLYSRYLTGKTFLWDATKESEERTLRFLIETAKEIGMRAILLPTNDELALFVARYARELRNWYIIPVQSPVLFRKMVNKKSLYALAQAYGIPTPETSFPHSIDEVAEFARTAKFPVMLKGIDGNRLYRRIGRKMVLVHTSEELLSVYRHAEDPIAPNIMLQEYIPFHPDTAWMFNGYFNERSECVFEATGKKIRQAPIETGYTSLGICHKNPSLIRSTKRFLRDLNYRGIVDIDFCYDGRDGKYKVIDINPRLGATFRLFVAPNGMDVVRALYLDMTGQPVPAGSPANGRKWFVEERDLISSVRYLSGGRLTFRSWLVSFRGVQEAAWFAWDDLMPFFFMWFALVVHTLVRFTKEEPEKKISLPPLDVVHTTSMFYSTKLKKVAGVVNEP